MRAKILFLCFAVFMISSNIYADTILLKSGRTVEANIIERNADSVKVDIEGIGITYYLSDIESVNGQKVTEPAQAGTEPEVSSSAGVTSGENTAEKFSSAAQTSPVRETLPSENAATIANATLSWEENATISEKISTTQQGYQEQGSKNEDTAVSGQAKMEVPVEKKQNTSWTPSKANYTTSKKIFSSRYKTLNPLLTGMSPVFSVLYFLINVAFYVFSSLCFHIIGKKTGTRYAWRAWIPIANVFLMLKIAGLSYLWLLSIFIVLIPLLGILALIGFSGYVCYRIALARGKAGWIGILMLVPIAGYAVLGYLAFSE
ncbi:MAG: hypothetical protein PHQ96_09815 [Candidatus Omnitrophica bacterium]|nr:hypothetical protein [Candidatus Omnitrophota bacterium]